jgi:hypothetical protein
MTATMPTFGSLERRVVALEEGQHRIVERQDRAETQLEMLGRNLLSIREDVRSYAERWERENQNLVGEMRRVRDDVYSVPLHVRLALGAAFLFTLLIMRLGS